MMAAPPVGLTQCRAQVLVLNEMGLLALVLRVSLTFTLAVLFLLAGVNKTCDPSARASSFVHPVSAPMARHRSLSALTIDDHFSTPEFHRPTHLFLANLFPACVDKVWGPLLRRFPLSLILPKP
jgi:hypothetical protein